MAIVKMSKISVYGLNSRRKEILEYLHKQGIVQIEDFDAQSQGLQRSETVKSIAQFDSYIASATSAMNILDKYSPEKKGMFSSRQMVGEENYSMKKNETEIVTKQIYEVIRLDKKIAANTDSIGKITMKQLQITPYMKLDIPMNYKGTNTTVTAIGTLQGMWDSTDILTKFSEKDLDECHFEILSSSKQQTCVMFVYLKEFSEEYSEFLRDIGFCEPAFSLSHRTTKEKYDKLEEDKQNLIIENKNMTDELMSYLPKREEFQMFYDHLVMRREKYDALSHLGLTENAFVLEGFTAEKNVGRLSENLSEKFGAYTEAVSVSQGEAPIAFSNNAFSSPVEGITSDYSMPSGDDIDPNPIMSIFYYLFFGMMFSDAGYGLLMVIACALLGFGNKIDKEKRRPYKMFFYCGISTTFWGIMYGSFFGDMIDTIAQKFLNSPVRFKPILLNPTEKPLELLILSVAFGMIHIITALCIKFYIIWRKGEKADAICDTGFWISALVGIGVFAAGMGLKITALDTIGKVLMIAGFAGLLITGGRKSENIFGKIFGGVLSLYDITSYVGDALSYSRLMALGLATGVIASVINVLGSLCGPSAVGIISYIVISIFGHSLNFAINCLGAYVHTNRLQYVEFYQKFYEGGGKKFEPFSMKTKYFNFSDK